MPDHIETVLRKSAPLFAAAVGVWGASILADELPDSVRASALQELRILDRTPADDPRRASPSRSNTASVTTTTPSAVKGTTTTATVIEHTAAANTERSSPSPDESAPSRPVSSTAFEATNTTPTIRPARPTIVRPPIRSRSADINPRNELSIPVKPTQPTEPDPTKAAIGSKGIATPTVLPSDTQTTTPEASPFAEVLNQRAASQPQAANPFDVDPEGKDWRPSAANTVASPRTSVPARQASISELPKPRQQKELSIAASKTADSSGRSKPGSEQIGADRPVSVLDFLAQSVGEPAGPTQAIANAKTLPSSMASTPKEAFAHTESATTSRATTGIEQRQSAVVANGLPRSVQSENPSQDSLESIKESDARLSTPPAAQVAREEAPTSEQQKLDARAGRDGFMGFCPVTLRDRKTLVDGKNEFSSNYGGERFEFATADAKVAFDADPERYSPAHAGRDIVLSAGHIDVPGSLRHATYYKNRLYLFRSEQTCRLFESDPARYVVEEPNSR